MHMINNNYVFIENIRDELIRLLEYVCHKHCQILVVRFDVRYPIDYNSTGYNHDISSMIAKLIQIYKHAGYDPYYFWVREQEDSYNPHYHCVLFLNANLVRAYHHVFVNAEKLWQSTIGTMQGGLIHHCTVGKNGIYHRNGIIINRSNNYEQNFEEVDRQLSYLAKSAGKCPYQGIRNFGMSRIN